MSRHTGRWAVAMTAGLLLSATTGPAAAYPGVDRVGAAGAGRLATIPLTTWGYGFGSHGIHVTRSGVILGGLRDEAGESHPVIWRRYDDPVPIELPDEYPVGMNNRLHIVGISGEAMDGTGWLWRPGGVTYLQSPGKRVSIVDLNDRDQVVGSLEDPDGDLPAQPFRWQDGRFTVLETPEGTHGYVHEVNNRGDVVGYVVEPGWTNLRSVLWRGTEMTVLRAPDGGMLQPYALNDRGQVVGGYTPADAEVMHPFLWERGRFVDLGAGRPDDHGWASDINDDGEIVGSVGNRAVLWRGGRMIDLGVPGGAERINERGDVAGIYYTVVSGSDLAVRAYRWRDGRLLRSAAVVGPEVTGGVSAIDERGRLVGGISNPHGTGNGIFAWVPAR